MGEKVNFNAWVDATTTLIQKRMLAIAAIYLNDTRVEKIPRTSPKISRLNAAVEELGHNICKYGINRFSCGKCGQSWTKDTRASIVKRGPCPGLGNWDEHTHPALPGRYIGSSAMVWAGKVIDIIHNIHYLERILFCAKCGAYAQGPRVENLTLPCPLKPRSSIAKYGLKRMVEARHPEGCLLYTSPSPRDATLSRMPSSA